MIPFLIGLILGVMGTLVPLTSRLSVIETTVAQHSKAIEDQQKESKELRSIMEDVRDRLTDLTTAVSGLHRGK
jgi:hypothetical protein